MAQESVNSATGKPSGVTSQNVALPDLPTEFITETLTYVWSDGDLRSFFTAQQGSQATRTEWIAALEKKQHPHRWDSLISANKILQPDQTRFFLKEIYVKGRAETVRGGDKSAREKALIALREAFASTDAEKSTVHWQKALILAVIDVAIKDFTVTHLVHAWLDCIRPHCPGRQARFQRLLCDSLVVSSPEAVSDLADNVRNYLLQNETANHESNLFFFFSAIAKQASLDFAKAYLQENIALLSVFCAEDVRLNETIQSASSSAELQNKLLRARLYKLYPEHRYRLQAITYSPVDARDAMDRLTIFRLSTLEALLPLLIASGLKNPPYSSGYYHTHTHDKSENRTYLNWAATNGHLKVVQCLLAAGAAVGEEGYSGKASLACAATGGDLEIVRCLLDAGAAVSARDNEGFTALIWAAYKGHLKVVQCLLDAGAAIDAKGKNGNTALTLAVVEGHLNVVQCLLKTGATVDLQDKNGRTALARAAAGGHLKIVQCLLAAGAKVGLQDKNGETAMSLAKIAGHTEIVALLKLHDNQTTSEPSFIGFMMQRSSQLIEWMQGKTIEAAPPVVGQPVNVDNASEHSLVTAPSGTSYLPTGPTMGEAASTEATGSTTHASNLTQRTANPFNLLSPELIAEILLYLWTDDDCREAFKRQSVDRLFRNAWIAILEQKQHPHRWTSLIRANKALQPGQLSSLLKAVYSQDTDARKKALPALKEVFASTYTENSAVHWQKALILAAIEAAIKDLTQLHLVHIWLDCLRPYCPRRQVRFQRLLCDSLAVCPPEAMPDLTDKVLNYLLRNKTENYESNLFFFFSAIAKQASLDFAKAYLQENIALLSVFCAEDVRLNETIQSASSSAELQNKLLRARLCQLYSEYRDGILQAMTYLDEDARSAMRRLTIPRLATLEALLPLLAAGGSMESLYGEEGRNDDMDDATALNWAASRGYLESVQCLLAAGAAVNAQDNNGRTALIWAVAKGHLEIVQYLLAAGAAVDLQNHYGGTALMAARHLEIVQCLLGAGAAVNLQTKHGWIALACAAARGNLKVVQCLLAAGAKTDLQDKGGRTALMDAAAEGHFEVVQCLLAAGAKTDLQDGHGKTALMDAAVKGHFEVVQCLLAAGAKTDLQDGHGKTALMDAAVKGHVKVVQCLLAAGAAVDAKDKDGYTALIWTVDGWRFNDVQVVQCLLAASAKVDLQTKGGWTALNLARIGSKSEIVALLKAHGSQETPGPFFIGFIIWGVDQLLEGVRWMRGEAVEAAPPVVGQSVNVNNAGGHSLVTNPSWASYLPTGSAMGEAAPTEATGTTQPSNLTQRTANAL